MDSLNLWIVMISLAIGSFALRFAFIGLLGDRNFPPWLMRHLRYTAVAVLPGLVAPLVVWPAATGGEIDPARLTAGLVTLTVGYFTKNVLLSIFCGALALFVGLYIGG